MITDGNANEKTVLRKFLTKDKVYVIDANSCFVGRLRGNAVWEVVEGRALSDTDKMAGIQRDIIVRLGCKGKQDDLLQLMCG